jgi:hypothetical protein
VRRQRNGNLNTAQEFLEQKNMRVALDHDFDYREGNCFYDALLYSDQFAKQYFCGIIVANVL